MIEDIKFKLSMLRVETKIEDIQIQHYLEQVKQEILSITNLKEIPDSLLQVVVIRTVGNILKDLNTSGLLVVNGEKIEDFNLSSITRGDVSMSYKGTSLYDKFNDLIASYLEYGKELILLHRVIRW